MFFRYVTRYSRVAAGMPCRLPPASNGNAISESHPEYEGHAHHYVIMGERERTHLVLQYVTMCIHVDWCLASFLSFLSSIVIMDMSQSLSI